MGLVAVQAEKASELVERKSRRNESCGGGQRRREELKQKGSHCSFGTLGTARRPDCG